MKATMKSKEVRKLALMAVEKVSKDMKMANDRLKELDSSLLKSLGDPKFHDMQLAIFQIKSSMDMASSTLKSVKIIASQVMQLEDETQVELTDQELVALSFARRDEF